MQPVFNALFIWLFICIYTRPMVNAATLWPGLFAQSVLRTPVFWPTPYHGASDELAAANLQQSESSGHLLGSAEHHMISSEDPIPSGLFIPVDQLHRELFNSPHLLRKHSSNHFPAYHQFALNHFHHHHPNKKLMATSKHHKLTGGGSGGYPSLSPKFKSLHKPANKKKSHKEEFAYLDDDFYSRNANLFNLNKLNGQLLSEYADYSPQDLDLGKSWLQRRPPSNDQDQTNSLINTTEEHQEEDDLFTIKNNAANNEPPMKSNNGGRIDLRKLNPKRKLQHLKDLKDQRDVKEYRDTKDVKDIREFKEMRELKDIRELKELRDAKEKELREFKELKEAKDGLESKETKDPKLTNENRYIENYDGRNHVANNHLANNHLANNHLANSANGDALSDKFGEKFSEKFSEKLSEKFSQPEHRNIERYNLEKFFQPTNEKFNHQANRNDGRILISNANNNARKEKSVFKNYKNPNGELSVISETIYQNHQLKSDNRRSPASRLVLMQNHDRFESDAEKKQQANNGNNESITIQTNPNLPTNDTGDDQSDDKDAQPVNPLKNEPPPKSVNKMEMLSEEQMNQQLFGTTWNAQRIIPTPQISYMQSMFTESNTVATNSDQAAAASKGTYSSERSQLNNQSNHFSSLAIWAIIVCSLIAALLFTGSSLFLMYKVSQIKRRRLMRFQETANRNQFEAAFPVAASSCKTTRTGQTSPDSGPSSNSLSNNIISNNNFIRQQKSLFSNLNARCNAGKSMLSIKEQLDAGQNFAVKKQQQHQLPSKTATINKKAGGKHLNLALGNRECYVTQIKTTAADQKNSALSRLISKMTSQTDEALNKSDSENSTIPPPPQQRVSFF